ncbi:hypothetical protein ANN_08495, partial [Periplaneta americana]
MSPGSSTESYPAFAHIGLRENPGKNLNQFLTISRNQHQSLCSIPRHRTSLYSSSYIVLLSRLCNSLPSDVRDCRTLSQFKSKLERRRGRPKCRGKIGVDEDAWSYGAGNWMRLVKKRDDWRKKFTSRLRIRDTLATNYNLVTVENEVGYILHKFACPLATLKALALQRTTMDILATSSKNIVHYELKMHCDGLSSFRRERRKNTVPLITNRIVHYRTVLYTCGLPPSLEWSTHRSSKALVFLYRRMRRAGCEARHAQIRTTREIVSGFYGCE